MLGSACFRGAIETATLNFPSYIHSISAGCFASTKIDTIDLSGLPADCEILNEAFTATTATTVIFPAELKTIGIKAFANSSGLTTIQWPTKPCGFEKTIFSGCTSLTEVELPSWITSLPDEMFAKCTSLVSVTMPEGLTEIGARTFSECSALTSVSLPSTLSVIGNEAFAACSLAEISFPASITKIGDGCFRSNKLASIVFPENLTEPDLSFGSNIFQSNQNLASFTFPDWMTIVPAGFFNSCDGLSTLVNFHPTEVRENAFYWNRSLKLPDGKLPEGLTTIGKSAFARCGYWLPQNVFFLDTFVVDNTMTIGDWAFDNARIRNVSVVACDDYFNGKEEHTFGASVLANNSSIKSITFPDCMTRIPDGFCLGWSSLTTIVWPKDIKAIGKDAFLNCTSLNLGDFDFESEFPWNQITEYGENSLGNTGITSVTWPAEQGNLVIGAGLFQENYSMKELVIPAWMHNVPDRLYRGCRNATKMTWLQPRDSEPVNIGANAFSNLYGLDKIEFPGVAVVLGSGAFSGTSKATMEWPEEPVTLSDGAFSGCNGIDFPSFPDYITYIPKWCFSNAKGLTKIHFPEQITNVDLYAFYGSGIQEAYFHGDIKLVNSEVFRYCVNLTTVSFDYPVISIGGVAFQDCRSLKNIIFCPEQPDLGALGGNAFTGCTSLETFIDHIGPYTGMDYYWGGEFSNCTSLKAVSLASYNAYYRVSDGNNPKTVMNDISLQSIQFQTRQDGLFQFSYPAGNVPLLGVSTQPVEMTVLPDAMKGEAERRDKKGILMVARGDRWKYEEAGYGSIWDIREYRTPDTEVTGTIHGDFNEGDNYNSYSSYISWDVNLCDLNPEGETVYTLWRRGNNEAEAKKVSTIYIGRPEEVEGVEDLNISTRKPTIQASVEIEDASGNRQPLETKQIDFDYEVSDNLYQMVAANQHSKLYFNKQTSRRIGTSEVMNDHSRILIRDNFISPKLDGSEGPVPDFYEYYVEASGFDYEEAVNNEDYTVDETTGVAYHLEPRKRAAFRSTVCRVYTPMALPSLIADGLYTTEQIEGDLDGTLPVSQPFSTDGQITVSYSFHPDVIKRQMLHGTTGTTRDWVVMGFTCYRIDDGLKQPLLTRTDIHNSPDGSVTTNQIAANTTFQLVTETTGRGRFGSRAIHVYGAPSLALDASKMKFVGFHTHAESGISSDLVMVPAVDDMGYTGANSINAINHRIGVWRTVTVPDSPANTVALADNETTVYHCSGPVESSFVDACETCSAIRHYDSENHIFTDVTESPEEGATMQAHYRTRLYVQLPDNPYRWMVAETADDTPEFTNGIDDIVAERPADAVYYDLQGQRITNPEAGQIVIMVTSCGSRKIRF